MEAEGIRVVEINLNLPGTVYCLCWTPERTRDPDLRFNRDTAQRVADRLDWRLLADGIDAGRGEVRLLFKTTDRNLDRGLSRLLRGAYHHRLYLVQPGQAARQAAEYVRGDRADPPGTHYELFMGGRAWADDMLDVLSRENPVPGTTRRGPTLTDIARRHPDTRQAIAEAYRCNGFSLKDIAEFFDMHFSEVSAVINASTMRNGKRAV